MNAPFPAASDPSSDREVPAPWAADAPTPIPTEGGRRLLSASDGPSGLARLDESAIQTALLAVSSDGVRLVVTPHPDVRTADGYLRMTARILLESQRQDAQTVGVVSAHEGEGRTAAAVNLAVCLGRANGRVGRVLLVDGDARNRALSKMFCGSDAPGADGGGRRFPVLIGTDLEGVDLLTAPVCDDGLTVSAPSAWMATFRELGAVYPHIVVDCPAVLESPEGMVLRECVQQLVLVGRAGLSTRTGLRRTLGPSASRVLGVILHGGPPGSSTETWR